MSFSHVHNNIPAKLNTYYMASFREHVLLLLVRLVQDKGARLLFLWAQLEIKEELELKDRASSGWLIYVLSLNEMNTHMHRILPLE